MQGLLGPPCSSDRTAGDCNSEEQAGPRSTDPVMRQLVSLSLAMLEEGYCYSMLQDVTTGL